MTIMDRKSLDLGRLPSQNDVLLRFVHISDTHISHNPNYNHAEADYTPMIGARRLVERINSLPFAPDFVLHTGDVVYDPDPQAYEFAREILSQLKYPTYYLMGNHDQREDLQRLFLKRTEILAPFDYEFEVKGVQFVVVDSNGPAKNPAGNVTEPQLEWLGAICKSDDKRPLVIAVHHNALPIGVPWWDTFMRMTNGEAFHKTLLPARHRLRGVFFGHVHQNTDVYKDGILYSSVLSSWYQIQCWPGQTATLEDRNSDPGFSIVTLSKDQTFIRRYRYDVPEKGQPAPTGAGTKVVPGTATLTAKE